MISKYLGQHNAFITAVKNDHIRQTQLLAFYWIVDS